MFQREEQRLDSLLIKMQDSNNNEPTPCFKATPSLDLGNQSFNQLLEKSTKHADSLPQFDLKREMEQLKRLDNNDVFPH
jgi:hypothetical protein